MKKIVLLAVVIAATSFASCKKAYKCECTRTKTGETYNGVAVPLVGGVSTQTETREISKSSKKSATAMCGNSTDTDTYTSTGGNVTIDSYATTCSLK